jgi:hypothetical protein
MQSNLRLLLPSLPLLRGIGLAVLALTASPAEAQLESWSASGDVRLWYREGVGGPLLARTAATVPQTVESDVIVELEIGGTSSLADDDPGSMSLSSVGNSEAARAIGDFDVKVGTLSLNDSFVYAQAGGSVGPGGALTLLLSEYTGPGISVDGSLTAQVSTLAANVRTGGIARISGIAGSISSEKGADVEIDASTLGSASFRGALVLTNSTLTGAIGSFREGFLQVESVSIDVLNGFGVGNNSTSTPTTADTDVIWTNTVVESNGASIGANGAFTTGFEMRGASLWRSFGLFGVGNPMTQMDVNSGSRIDARADFGMGGGTLLVRSGVPSASRIDVAEDFDLGSTVASTLTIEEGGYVDVDGTLTIGPLSTLNLNGGTLRVGALDEQGVLNENGGTLIVPEAAGVAPPLAAALALALLRRRRG